MFGYGYTSFGVYVLCRRLIVKMQEEFDGVDLGSMIPNWTRTDMKRAYWSGNGLDWDYKGWRDHVSSHFDEHPVWLACKGEYTCRKMTLSDD